MSSKNRSIVDVSALAALYRSEAAAKAIFDHFARRQYNSAKTTVDRLQASLKQEDYEVSRSDIIDFFRKLESAHCGEFVIGRKGHSSRFEWATSLISVGQAAAGEVAKVDVITEAEKAEDPEDETDAILVEHRYRLRPTFELKIMLPTDLTSSEAGRLADFIRTLPFA
jgi:hypothetical protein